jgi:hypothetical protein
MKSLMMLHVYDKYRDTVTAKGETQRASSSFPARTALSVRKAASMLPQCCVNAASMLPQPRPPFCICGSV